MCLIWLSKCWEAVYLCYWWYTVTGVFPGDFCVMCPKSTPSSEEVKPIQRNKNISETYRRPCWTVFVEQSVQRKIKIRCCFVLDIRTSSLFLSREQHKHPRHNHSCMLTKHEFPFFPAFPSLALKNPTPKLNRFFLEAGQMVISSGQSNAHEDRSEDRNYSAETCMLQKSSPSYHNCSKTCTLQKSSPSHHNNSITDASNPYLRPTKKRVKQSPSPLA